MGNTNSSNKISAQDKAILDMKNQRDKLQQYQKRIKVVTDRETEVARECLRQGHKEKALLALRRKKYQESLLSKTDQQLAQLQALTSDVEFALVQKDVVFGLQQGTAVLKEIHKEMGGLEKVELIMSETEEAQAYQNEINEMLGGKMSNEDEDEVEDELLAMEREANGVPAMPDAPTKVQEPMPEPLAFFTSTQQHHEQTLQRPSMSTAYTDERAEPLNVDNIDVASFISESMSLPLKTYFTDAADYGVILRSEYIWTDALLVKEVHLAPHYRGYGLVSFAEGKLMKRVAQASPA
ncbi:hypothetical protein Q7P37_001514 [Cladosporium fusiforme]